MARRWSPLLPGLVSLLLAVFVMPSALNVPQSTPSETLEFAPVPPEDDAPPPADVGNVGSLSLGSSSSVTGETTGGEGPGTPPPPPPPPPPPGGVGDRPVTKACVGTPPRQTADPMSPPCVAHFDGDNGGATHTGVTDDEIRFVVYLPGSSTGASSRGLETTPSNTLVDLWVDPQGDEPVYTRVFRGYQAHFNDRYQTYGRKVHFFIQYGGTSEERTAEHMRSDAVAIKQEVAAFAVLGFPRTNTEAFYDTLNDLGIVSFVGNWTGITGFGQPESFFRRRPGLAWSYNPSLDTRAAMFTSYVCTKALGHPVSFSGNDDHGQPRVFGLLRQTANTDDGTLGELIAQQLTDCGVPYVERTYSSDGDASVAGNDASGAATNIAAFQGAGVTTVIKTGSDLVHSHAAGQIGWYPEWLVAGNDTSEREFQGRAQNQTAYQYARAVTAYPLVTDPRDQACYQAYVEADPQLSDTDVLGTACQFFHHLRQVFIGIQVAGPRLTPEAMDRGFHAIPAIPSGDPRVPACFYGPGDYTCVKDAQAQWWDPSGQAPGRRGTGCWRVMEGATRYLVGHWPAGDVEEQRGDATTDPCTTQGPDVT